MIQAPKKELSSPADSGEGSSASGSPADSDDDEAAQGTAAADPQVLQAATASPKLAAVTSSEPAIKPPSAARKPAPVAITARLQQSAAAAAAARGADSPPGAAAAVEIVIPLVQVAALQSEPLLAPSVSPRLPYGSAEIGALPARSPSKSPYGGADPASRNAPDAAMQQSVSDDDLGDSTDKNDSAELDADFFAARAAAAATAASEEPGVSAAPIGAKANRGTQTSFLICRQSLEQSVYLCSRLWVMQFVFQLCCRGNVFVTISAWCQARTLR